MTSDVKKDEPVNPTFIEVRFEDKNGKRVGRLKFDGETPVFEGNMTAAEFQKVFLHHRDSQRSA